MSCRRLALALVLLPAVAGAQGFEYAPSTSQYRITSATKVAQEVMGQRQEFESSSNQLVTVTVARASKDTATMTAVLDSLSVVGPMGMTPPGLDKLVGARVTTRMAPNGVVYSTEAAKMDSLPPNASQIFEEMGRLLPRVKAKLGSGASWTDTTSVTANQGGLAVQRNVIAKYTVVGDTTVGADKSWKLSRESTTALSGSGESQGQQMTLEGTSTGKGTLLMGQKGVLVGFQNEEQVDIKVVLAASGMEIGITQTVNTKYEKVK